MDLIKGDFVKSVINMPRKMLNLLNIYPENQNKFTKLSFIVLFLSVACLEMGQSVYMIQNFMNITVMASTCTTVSTNFQALCKLIILYINMDHIKSMLEIFWFEFWPVHFATNSLKISLRTHAQSLTVNMVGMLMSAIIFAAEFLALPIIKGNKLLPFASYLPFDWTQSPVYEIIYALQVLTNVFCVILTICGHDFLFFTLMLSTIAQFRMLQQFMRDIGGENVIFINKQLSDWIVDEDESYAGDADPDIELMRKCIRHHIKLLKFCDDLERIFSATVFVQYVASTSAICVSSFLISLIEKSSVRHLISFCIGHVFQLFLYCIAGNELVYQSNELAVSSFESQWYMSNNLQLRRNLIMIIQRAQKEKKITALGFIDLNFESFVKVLKLSFSFHTLLNSINEK